MISTALILYGPPAAGKDTISQELERRDSRYAHFSRLKCGGGRMATYRPIDESRLVALQQDGQILYSNRRYGATYAIDKGHLDELIDAELIPVIHLGQVAGISAVVRNYRARWVVIGLWCSRAETLRRLQERGDKQTFQRLAAWDATASDFCSADPSMFAMTLNTEMMAPHSAAHLIDACRTSVEAV